MAEPNRGSPITWEERGRAKEGKNWEKLQLEQQLPVIPARDPGAVLASVKFLFWGEPWLS